MGGGVSMFIDSRRNFLFCEDITIYQDFVDILAI